MQQLESLMTFTDYLVPSCSVVVKGGGDLGTGVAWRLHRCGFRVIVTEIAHPTVVRRAVAFASAVYEELFVVDGVTARLVASDAETAACWSAGEVPVLVDPQATVVQRARPVAVIDAIVAKRNCGTRITDAPIVVAVGPGFAAGVDCHAVVESNRGHSLGRAILDSTAEPNTGIPGTVGGEDMRRVLHAPASGIMRPLGRIGDVVHAGDLVARIDDTPLHSQLDGVIRGLLHAGLYVRSGFKVGDIDPRGIVSHCFTISDKALAIAGGVVEAILYLLRERQHGNRA
jgi:xanthine dehydrogenase accessory factor